MEKEVQDEGRVTILGYSKSRLEVFLNGIIFLMLQIGHEVFSVVNQLPSNWTHEDLEKVDRPIVVPMFLFVISYYLMSVALFGGEGRMDKMQQKYGTWGIFLRRYSLIFSIILVSLLTPIYIIILFF
jgi:hypothetical protein